MLTIYKCSLIINVKASALTQHIANNITAVVYSNLTFELEQDYYVSTANNMIKVYIEAPLTVIVKIVGKLQEEATDMYEVSSVEVNKLKGEEEV